MDTFKRALNIFKSGLRVSKKHAIQCSRGKVVSLLPPAWYITVLATPPSCLCLLFPLFHPISSLFCASLLIYNLLVRWLVPQLEPRHWYLVPFSDAQLAVGSACNKNQAGLQVQVIKQSNEVRGVQTSSSDGQTN